MATPIPPLAAVPPSPAASAPAPTPVMPSFLTGALRVFDLSLGRMLWSRGTVFMGLLVGLPVVIGCVLFVLQAWSRLGTFQVDNRTVPGPILFGAMIWLLYLRFIVPVLAVFYGTSLVADEVEDKTITYLFTRPIPRGAVMAGKYLAYLVCTIMVVLPSVMLVYFLVVPFGGGSIAASFPDLVKDLVLLAIGLIAYGAVFAWVGARFNRPLLTGLIFVFGWEQIALVLGYLKRFTVIYYVQALVPHAMPSDSILGVLQSLVTDTPSLFTSLVSLAVITGLFLWWAIRIVEQREYVLEQ
jgi:ABC-type transport system involved in multi-copper enzyme maturation permease subunit